MPDPLIGVDGFAAILDTTSKAIRHRRSRGQLPPAVKIGRRLFWRSEDVDAWIASHLERDETPASEARVSSESSALLRVEEISHG